MVLDLHTSRYGGRWDLEVRSGGACGGALSDSTEGAELKKMGTRNYLGKQ
ncbi:hypothetical protein COLO4_27335 [Corchorus olitorius]|uniref:Uncharacterized protein n=1 Tax=Corchorus olitorius TaxID=93759 RepID=A0A1R3HRU9_9ROSI|nr:hypothetical protein COLO4_27335 [Corchorus olitorius]